MSARMKNEPRAGLHSYAGEASPLGGGKYDAWFTQESFSVGVFEWVPKKDGSGLKRGPVKVRVRGLVVDANAVADRAREICAALDAGTYTGPRHVRVRVPH